MIRVLVPTMSTLAKEAPMTDHPTRESLGDTPIGRVHVTIDPEEAPAVPAAIPPEGEIDWRSVANNNAARAELAEAEADRFEQLAADVDHARYKTALFVLAGCLLVVGALVLALAHDLRRRIDQ